MCIHQAFSLIGESKPRLKISLIAGYNEEKAVKEGDGS